MPDIPLGTVVGPQGPQGPKGDTGTFSPEDLQRITDLESGKVDKVAGKGLSTNDYTNADKSAVDTIGNKVDKVTGKGLSTNDYTTAEKNKLSGIEAQANKTIIDSTLSNPGQAADAKAAGDALAVLRDYIASMTVFREASGNPATFSDAKAANVMELSVRLTPTQSGSGDPSPTNVRPISGVSSVSVTRSGKNLSDLSMFTNDSIGGYGRILPDRPARLLSPPIPVTPGLPYSVSVSGNVNGNPVVIYEVHQYGISEHISYSTISSTSCTVTAEPGAVYFRLLLRTGADDTLPVSSVTWIQMEQAAGPTAYELYRGQSVTVQLTDGSNPLTVYGGTLDVTTGTLTVTHKYVDLAALSFTADLDWASIPVFGTELSDKAYFSNSHSLSNSVCSHYPLLTRNAILITTTSAFAITSGGKEITVADPRFNTAEDFKAWLSAQASANTPVCIAYELATPVTYQLIPAQLATLAGYNAIFSNAGPVAVTYKADASIILGGG